MGHEVTILVDRGLDHFVRDYAWVKPAPRIVRGNLMSGGSNLRSRAGPADLVIGVPIQGVNVAVALARANGCPAWAFLYDPPPLLVKYRGSEGVRETKIAYWNDLRRVILRGKATVVTLGKFNVGPTRKWLGRKDNVTWLYPAVNEAHALPYDKRKPWATWISRIVPHKKFPHALDAIKPFNLHLNAFCARAHPGIVKGRKMGDRVTFYVNQPDTVKFEALAQSMVLVHTATYEGFGMPLIEAMYCGVPVVCYDYPMFREIIAGSPATVLLARDRSHLVNLIGSACNRVVLQQGVFRDTRFGMKRQRERLAELLNAS
jgi:glycosyltransferase involved in cell wall biosynthesis